MTRIRARKINREYAQTTVLQQDPSSNLLVSCPGHGLHNPQCIILPNDCLPIGIFSRERSGVKNER